MNRRLMILVISLAALALTGCQVNAEERFGEAAGYGGKLRVAVTTDGGRITGVRVVEHHETEGVGTRAIETLPDEIVRANTTEVDSITGATVTSSAIKTAVLDAMSPLTMFETKPPQNADDASLLPPDIRRGVGMASTARLGPGTDGDGNPVYSLNIVFAAGLFDGEGRIVDLSVDQLELASLNAESLGMSVFAGWPESNAQTDAWLAKPASWKTKRQLGEQYMLGSGSWAQEMDAFQRLFRGMTMAEVDQWYAAYCSDATGKPLHADAPDDDQPKYAALNEDERAKLADVTSAATMSLRGVHGDILTAIRRAWEDASAAR